MQIINSCHFILQRGGIKLNANHIIPASLWTHLVQSAVSVGQVEGFQAVGLTQEVVEMLNVRQNMQSQKREDEDLLNNIRVVAEATSLIIQTIVG